MEIPLVGIVDLDRFGPVPLHLQLYQGLREAILSEAIRPGSRIPPSRIFADQLGISRKTVTAALDQLACEGFLESRQGAGTWVSDWRADIEADGRNWDGAAVGETAHVAPARRWRRLLADGRPAETARPSRPLRPGLPDLRLFPSEIWSRLMRTAGRRLSADDRGYVFASGHPLLKEALAGHLAERRLVSVDQDQLVVTSSAQAALDLAARLLIEPGDRVWIEDPGYRGARGAFRQAGADLVPVPVDEDGLNIAPLLEGPPPKLIYVTPSHQYPMGSALSLARRHALIAYALDVGATIVEDDYDSEFHYESRPIAALQGLRPDAPVVYVGTFSKTVSPSLRLGFLAAPESLVAPLALLQRNTGQSAATDIQVAAAAFLAEGHYASHLRRSQRHYAERRHALLAALDGLPETRRIIHRPQGGLQLTLEFPGSPDDTVLVKRLDQEGVDAEALSRFCIGEPKRNGLLLGFAPWTELEIGQAASVLARVLSDRQTLGGDP